MRQMAFSNVNFYVIDPSGLSATSPARADGGQEGFARETGGHAFLNTNDLNGAADRILRESATYYLVDVPDPPVGARADLRQLELKSLRNDVTVRARHAIPEEASCRRRRRATPLLRAASSRTLATFRSLDHSRSR